jgi:hypothetical protein
VWETFFFSVFGGTGILTQGFTLARQVLCHSNHTSSPVGNFLRFTLLFLQIKDGYIYRELEKQN